MNLPTFEQMRRNAFALLGDAEDELRSDWRVRHRPTGKQSAAAHTARQLIAQAKNALDRAARP